MHNHQEKEFNPNHAAPVGRLKLEVVNLKTPAMDASVTGTVATASLTGGSTGCFADEE